MCHILLDIKYECIETLLYHHTEGENIIKSWCEFNNHSLVMSPITHIFPTVTMKNNDADELSLFKNYSILNNINENIVEYNGYTSIGILKESHISIHTYPELNSIQIDFFSCKKLDKKKNEQFMRDTFKKSKVVKYDLKFIERPIN